MILQAAVVHQTENVTFLSDPMFLVHGFKQTLGILAHLLRMVWWVLDSMHFGGDEGHPLLIIWEYDWIPTVAEILHQLIGRLPHYLQGFSTIPGGWEWDFSHQQ